MLGLDPHKIKVVVMREGPGEDVTLKHAREALGVPVYWRTPSDYSGGGLRDQRGQARGDRLPALEVRQQPADELADMLTAAGPGPKAGAPASKRSTSLLRMVWNPKSLPGA